MSIYSHWIANLQISRRKWWNVIFLTSFIIYRTSFDVTLIGMIKFIAQITILEMKKFCGFFYSEKLHRIQNVPGMTVKYLSSIWNFDIIKHNLKQLLTFFCSFVWCSFVESAFDSSMSRNLTKKKHLNGVSGDGWYLVFNY